jgi:hypothetical protein
MKIQEVGGMPQEAAERVEYRIGVLYPGSRHPHYFSTTKARWAADAMIYLRFGESIGQERIIWREKRAVYTTDWADAPIGAPLNELKEEASV